MKKILMILVMGVLVTGCFTTNKLPEVKEEPQLEVVIDSLNASKDELYLKVNTWFVENFNSAESVIEYQDKEAGRIMGKYIFEYSTGMGYLGWVKQTIIIDIKDNKIRIIIKDPYYRTNGNAMWGQNGAVREYTPITDNDDLKDAKEKWNNLIQSLKEYLKQINNNW